MGEKTDDIMTRPGKTAAKFREVLAERTDFYEQVRNYVLLGATEYELAEFFGVSRDAWLSWAFHSQAIRDAVEQGGIMADARVAHALYKRAVGYEYKRQRLVIGKKDGHATVHDLIEHVPGDVMAQKIWLVNRSKKWTDKQQHEHGGSVEVDHELTVNFIVPPDHKMIDVTPSPPLEVHSSSHGDKVHSSSLRDNEE